MSLRTCVSPSGTFIYGIHRPAFRAQNFRENDFIEPLGYNENGDAYENRENFPESDVTAESADVIFEIPNAFPFRGTTYICRSWADAKAMNPSLIALPDEPPPVSFSKACDGWFKDGDGHTREKVDRAFETLPEPLLIALAATSTDPDDLVRIAEVCCDFVYDESIQRPKGLLYRNNASGSPEAVVKNRVLYEVLANNRYLPDAYKDAMVLKPGVQGTSEIVGEYGGKDSGSHVFEYLRCNSYIPWGHYAANMANDAIRYRVQDLTGEDMKGLRHLYYQRTFARLAAMLGLDEPQKRRPLAEAEIEALRKHVLNKVREKQGRVPLAFNSTLWGWNFGFDFAPSHYRLHASHQQIHQQFALVPSGVSADQGAERDFPAYACGDMIREFMVSYRRETGHAFFDDYIRAIRSNRRMDGRQSKENSLIVYKDDHVMVFVPKAQTSQWELQMLTVDRVGNILEADTKVRESIDRAMLMAVKVLERLGARMVTTIEYSKRFDSDEHDQRLLYSFLPRLPESPGAFSEAQLRWINGHYPEDFAAACRAVHQHPN